MNESLPYVLVGITAIVVTGGAVWLARRRTAARQLYRRALESAMADGTLTPDEVAELERIRQEKDLTADEVRVVARTLYRSAIQSALADERLSEEEDETLARLQAQLGLSEEELGEDLVKLARLRLLARVETGELPSVGTPVSLAPHERCHWVVQASLADRLDLPRRTRVDLEGTEFVLNARKPFSAAGPREELRPNEEILPVDLGMFVVTSRRAIFQGARRTVTVPFARLDAVTLFADGLRLKETGNRTSHFILVEDAEVTVAILLQAAQRRREEIRPARTGDRTA